MSRLRSFVQGALVGVGLFLLAIALPYQSPLIRYFTPPFGERTAMEITLPLPGIPPILFGPGSLFLLALFVVALTVFTAGFTPSLKRFALSQKSILQFLVTGLLFLFISVSGFINGGFDSLKASGRLTLGLLSFVLIIGNSIPLVLNSRFTLLGGPVLTPAWGRVKEGLLAVKPWHFMGAVFLVEFVLTSGAAYYVFDRIPFVVDSIAQLFHAKIFAMGKLTVPSPPMPEFFEMVHMINNGRWYSQFPPGHAALLALGVLPGVPWLINPLLGSGTVVLIYKLGVELYGEGIGRVSALLALVSPFLLFMSAEMMSHTSAMFFFSLFALYFVRTLRVGRISFAITAGCGLGMLVCIRPYTAVALSLPFFLHGTYSSFKERKFPALPTLAFVLTTSIFVLLLLMFNDQTNGSPFVFGYQVLWGSDVLPGLGNASWGKPLTFVQGMLNMLDNLLGLQKFLFEWPLPSLLPLAILLWGGSVNRWDKLLLATVASLAFAYCFYWFHQWLFGPRFLFEATPLLIVLTARGLQQVPGLVKKWGGSVENKQAYYARTAGIVLLCSVLGLTANIPHLVKEYRGNGFDRSVLEAVERKGIRKGVVFTESDYRTVFPANPPDLESGVIYVRDLGRDKNCSLMEVFRGYDFYRASGSEVEPYDPGFHP